MKKLFLFFLLGSISINTPAALLSQSDTKACVMSTMAAATANALFKLLEDTLKGYCGWGCSYQNSFISVYHINDVIQYGIVTLVFLACYHYLSSEHEILEIVDSFEARFQSLKNLIKNEKFHNSKEIIYDLELLKHELNAFILTSNGERALLYKNYHSMLKKRIKKYSALLQAKIDGHDVAVAKHE